MILKFNRSAIKMRLQNNEYYSATKKKANASKFKNLMKKKPSMNVINSYNEVN